MYAVGWMEILMIVLVGGGLVACGAIVAAVIVLAARPNAAVGGERGAFPCPKCKAVVPSGKRTCPACGATVA